MIGSTTRPSWLCFQPMAQQLSLLKDDLLDPVDALLADPELVHLVRTCLAGRRPKSTRTGRDGIAPDRLLRCCVLKHLKGWSFRELERERRSNLIYRRFTRFEADVTPDFSTFSRVFALLSPPVTDMIHERVVGVARDRGVAHGRKLRVDTTCVESHIHYPTDSALLGDGIRVLTRGLVRIAAECRRGAVEVVDHGRAVKHRLLEISRAAKALTAAGRQRLQDSYAKLVALTRGVVRQVKDVVVRVASRRLRVVGDGVQVDAQAGLLRHYLPMVEQVIAQTQARVWGGDRHVPGKILSLFEPHTEVIRKGKAHKPNEFGRLVRLDEVEHGIVSGYAVLDGNPADTNAFLPALDHHIASFGHAPALATADRGFFSAANERAAEARGVAKVALPARGPWSKTRAARQKQRWFRRALRWRAGCEATISTLKHPFSMARATYKGEPGFQRYVGWSVITKNLCAIARWQKGRTLKRRRRAAVG